jgi:exopolysaccharide biosynthesis polyprenyl glycosylphosphotransferase
VSSSALAHSRIGTPPDVHADRLAKGTALVQTIDRTIYRVTLAVFELFAVIAAWRATAAVRLLLNPYMTVQLDRAELERLAPGLAAVIVLWVFATLWLGSYRQGGDPTFRGNLVRGVQAALLSSTLVVIVVFFSRQLGAEVSRSFVLLFVPISFVMLSSARAAAHLLVTIGGKRWLQPESVAVLGSGPTAERLVDRLRAAADGAAAVGVILPAGVPADRLSRVPVLGTKERLAEAINRNQLKRIILLDGQGTEEDVEDCSRIARRMGVIVTRVISAAPREVRMEFSKCFGVGFLDVRPTPFTRQQEALKRGFDIVVSLLLLVLLAPLFGVCAALIRLTSEGPVFYKSRRVGRGGRHFTFLKFRTMRQGAQNRDGLRARNEQSGHLFKMRNDPRVTPIGRVMRRFSIDELPQLINVLFGDMSLIGPRPLPAEDLDPDGQSREFAAWSELRSRVLPGLTGLWQIHGRSDVPFEQMIQFDTAYIHNWSLRLDLRILLETPRAVITGRGAY